MDREVLGVKWRPKREEWRKLGKKKGVVFQGETGKKKTGKKRTCRQKKKKEQKPNRRKSRVKEKTKISAGATKRGATHRKQRYEWLSLEEILTARARGDGTNLGEAPMKLKTGQKYSSENLDTG